MSHRTSYECSEPDIPPGHRDKLAPHCRKFKADDSGWDGERQSLMLSVFLPGLYSGFGRIGWSES